MAQSKKPYVFTNIVRKAWDSSQVESHDTKYFKTYRELVKNLKDLIKASDDNTVTVYRTRRGEWGEWFEKWGLENDKLNLIKQGWM